MEQVRWLRIVQQVSEVLIRRRGIRTSFSMPNNIYNYN